jgi:hypothetical protein
MMPMPAALNPLLFTNWRTTCCCAAAVRQAHPSPAANIILFSCLISFFFSFSYLMCKSKHLSAKNLAFVRALLKNRFF